jgi:hypothetical protein
LSRQLGLAVTPDARVHGPVLPEEVEARRASEERYGVTSRDLLRVGGLSDRQIDSLLSCGALWRHHAEVFQWTGVPRSKEGDWLAAVLGGGSTALLSGRPAVVHLGWSGPKIIRPEITVVGTAKPRLQGVVVRRTDRLDPADRQVRGGIAVMSAPRLLLDVAWQLDDDTFEEVVEDAFYRGDAHPIPLRRTLDRLGGRGRRGSARLRRYLDNRDADERPPESKAELLAARVFREFGIRELVRQHWVRIEGQWIRIDFAVPRLMVAVEINSLRYHGGTRGNLQRTSTRAALLGAHGWLVVPLTWWDLKQRGEWSAMQVQNAIDLRRRTGPPDSLSR